MAGGVTASGIWAVVGETQWAWFFGEPIHRAADLDYYPMEALPYRNAYVVTLDDGTELEVTGKEVIEDNGLSGDRVKKIPRNKEDEPFIGFDNLPEPEFGTGWDDFDWSK